MTGHIDTLRLSLLRIAIVMIGLMVFLFCVRERLLNVLLHPLLVNPNAPAHIVFSGIPELFFVYLKIATWGGVFIGLPYAFYELWRFLSPGLYSHEKHWVWPLLVAVPLLFYLGGVFAYVVVVPSALSFFLGFYQPGLEALPNLSDYLKFLFSMCFAMGAAFNLPVILVLLVRVGILQVEQLKRFRRFAIVLIFIVAAVMTPPDPFSQIAMAVPLVLLYEAAIFAAARLKK